MRKSITFPPEEETVPNVTAVANDALIKQLVQVDLHELLTDDDWDWVWRNANGGIWDTTTFTTPNV